MNKRGFSSLMLLVLGGLMVIIAVAYGAFIQSENGQLIDSANSATKSNNLIFVAQSMQADFFNNQLQVDFEDTVNDFLSAGTHIIDPQGDFDDNLGRDIEELLESEMGGIVSGRASEAYSVAYSSIPSISCSPLQQSGGRAIVNIRANSDGTLDVGSTSIGQRIKCLDSEAKDEITIDLKGRNYRINTRAVLIHDTAIKTISEVKKKLEETKGIEVISGGWRLANNETVKTNLLRGQQGWESKIALMGPMFSFVGKDGIILDPVSLKIKNGQGTPFTVSDLHFSCDGDVKSAVAGGPQTCRPDNLNVHIGEPMPGNDKEMEIKIEDIPSSSDFEIKLIDSGIEFAISSKLGDKIGDLISKMTKSLTEGYVDYSGGATHLCNRFKARPDKFTLSGTIVETNPNYLPADSNNLRFNFKVDSIPLDTSDISSNIDCQDDEYDNILKTNVYDLLTNGGQEAFKIDINGGRDGKSMSPDINNVDDLKRIINENAMVRTVGGGNGVSVEVNSKSLKTSSTVAAPTSPNSQSKANVGAINSGVSDPQNSIIQKNLRSSINTGNTNNAYNMLMNMYDDASGSLASIGEDTDAKALAKSSTAVCKLVGMKNWMDLDNKQMAMLAICGMGIIGDEKVSKIVCTLAAVYQAVESGSAEATIMVLAQMMGDIDMKLYIKADQIRAAVDAKDVEAVLLIAAEAAKENGDLEGFDVITQLAAIVKGVDTDNPLPSVALAFDAIGDSEMAELFRSIEGVRAAVDGGDFEASISAAARLAKSLGYSGLVDVDVKFVGLVGAYEAITNLDGVEVACKELALETAICADVAMGPLICGKPPPQFSDCAYSYSGPSLDASNFCDDLVFDLGFKVDCTCFYTCPVIEGVVPWPRSIAVNINQLRMILAPDQYADLFANYNIDAHLGSPDLMNYCRLDP